MDYMARHGSSAADRRNCYRARCERSRPGWIITASRRPRLKDVKPARNWAMSRYALGRDYHIRYLALATAAGRRITAPSVQLVVGCLPTAPVLEKRWRRKPG